MKRFFKNIILSFVAVLLFACSDDFVNEQLDISGVGESAVIISPDWDADNYQFLVEGLGNASFSITRKPDWLEIETTGGTFVNGVATIRCKANTVGDYSATGIYIDQLLVSSGSKSYAVPVYYITEGNPALQVARNLAISYNNYASYLQISNTGDGILLWNIISMPDWLTIDLTQFDQSSVLLGQGTVAQIVFLLDAEKAAGSTPSGTIVLQTNDRNNPLVEITVSADLGTPQLTVYSYSEPVDFGATGITKTLSFYNSGNGLLTWSFDGLPDWLTVSPSSGMLYSYNSTEVVFTCDRSTLDAGLTTATVYLKSNDPSAPSYPISVVVRMPGNNENVFGLEGNLIDASFDKNTNTLYYVTAQPNELVVYDVTARTVAHELALDKAPTSLAISEDFTKAAVGHGGLITAIDLSSYTVTKTFDYGYTIYDIEWAKDDWFCYTKAGTYMNNLLWINTSSSETAESDDNQMDEGTNIKKIPGQPYAVAARRYTSPTGITVFDLDTKLEKSYRHQSIGDFWFSGDGEYVFSAGRQVYKTNALVAPSGWNAEEITSVGTLQYPGNNYEDAPWIDHCPATHSIFGLRRDDYYTISSMIYQFEDNDYTLVNSFMYDNYYQPDAQTTAYEVEARYLFANSAGTELSVLRKGKSNNNWSIEFIPVE